MKKMSLTLAAMLMAGAAGTALAEEPQQIYSTYCQACHAAGVAGAPKLGDTEAWAPRIEKGMDTLVDHVVNGFNAMPPKGTCMSCSEEDLKATVDYMVGQSQ